MVSALIKADMSGTAKNPFAEVIRLKGFHNIPPQESYQPLPKRTAITFQTNPSMSRRPVVRRRDVLFSPSKF
jgi:hypothetical protein